MRGGLPIEGSIDFVIRLLDSRAKFQIFTNNSMYTPEDHARHLNAIGYPVEPFHIYTSALATARFVGKQDPGASAYVIGEHGLTAALQDAGCRISAFSPNYVVLGEAISYHYEHIATGAELVAGGARFIATSPDVNGPTERGLHPACGAVAALIERAAGRKPYFIGKPNPCMMRCVLERLGARAGDSVMVGDRMDTDVLAGIELGLRTFLALTSVTKRSDIDRFPYQPDLVLERLADLVQHDWL